MFRIATSLYLFSLFIGSAFGWQLSKWEYWSSNTPSSHRFQVWNLWYTDVVSFYGKGWESLVWDWGSDSKLVHKLEDGHDLLRFVSFEESGKWLALWLNTWNDGNLSDTFLLYELDDSNWKKTTTNDVDVWSLWVSNKWSWLNPDTNTDNLTNVSGSWPTYWLVGTLSTSLQVSGKWYPKWKKGHKNDTWEWVFSL